MTSQTPIKFLEFTFPGNGAQLAALQMAANTPGPQQERSIAAAVQSLHGDREQLIKLAKTLGLVPDDFDTSRALTPLVQPAPEIDRIGLRTYMDMIEDGLAGVREMLDRTGSVVPVTSQAPEQPVAEAVIKRRGPGKAAKKPATGNRELWRYGSEGVKARAALAAELVKHTTPTKKLRACRAMGYSYATTKSWARGMAKLSTSHRDFKFEAPALRASPKARTITDGPSQRLADNARAMLSYPPGAADATLTLALSIWNDSLPYTSAAGAASGLKRTMALKPTVGTVQTAVSTLRRLGVPFRSFSTGRGAINAAAPQALEQVG